MPDNRNRKRPIQVKFFVDEKEQALIKKKMEQAGIENMSAYIRKMVIDGYVVKLDMPELRELTLRMKSISNSENQIAKRVNSTGSIYEADIEEIKKNQEEIYEGIRKILTSLSKIEWCPAPQERSRFWKNRWRVWDVAQQVFAKGSNAEICKKHDVCPHVHCLPSMFLT